MNDYTLAKDFGCSTATEIPIPSSYQSNAFGQSENWSVGHASHIPSIPVQVQRTRTVPSIFMINRCIRFPNAFHSLILLVSKHFLIMQPNEYLNVFISLVFFARSFFPKKQKRCEPTTTRVRQCKKRHLLVIWNDGRNQVESLM